MYDDEGKPSFKLDRLAPANNISHGNAHDALADVNATIGLAKCIRQTQPALFDYALSLRNKKVVEKNVTLFEPMLHTSGMYTNALSCTRLSAAVAYHPLYKDRAIVFNVDQDPQLLLDLSLEALQTRLFTKQQDLPEGVERVQLKEMVFNKSPMFISNVYKLKPSVQIQLDLNMEQALERIKFMQTHQKEITQKVSGLYRAIEFETDVRDVDQLLYSGFFDNADRQIISHIQGLDKNGIAAFKPNFTDQRLPLLWLHFKARNYPDLLSEKEADYWFETIQDRLQEGKGGYLNFDDFFEKINTLTTDSNQGVLNSLTQYAQELM